MTVRRCVLVLLARPRWVPPGIDRDDWRRVLAEDAVDLLAGLRGVDTGLAVTPADHRVAEAVRWPDTMILTVSAATPVMALDAAYRSGYQQAAVLACDAPDLPAMLIGKLLQPLGRCQAAVAPATAGGLLGIAACLPTPDWLIAADPYLDTADPATLRQAAAQPAQLEVTPGWHRLRDPDGLRRLDTAVEGWEATRSLLSAS